MTAGQLEASGILLLVVLALWALMWAGWRRRARRDGALPEPARPEPAQPAPSEPSERSEQVLAVHDGVYVATTHHGQPLNRVTAHGLGTRSAVELVVRADGVRLFRQGARSVHVPAADLVDVGRSDGMVGKFVGNEGLLLITWRLGDTLLDTGLRLRSLDDLPAAEAALRTVLEGAR